MLFPWYVKYPYQNDEVLNLDWVLKTIDSLVKEVADFVTLNTIKYADPIQWNITTQYEKNTVVIDPISGSAYISTKPVPAGVGLNNTDYWNIIFTLDVISANKNITLRDDANNMLATFESEIGDWLLWQGTLYVVTRNIEIGQAYVEDYNIERYTVEKFVRLYISNTVNYIDSLVGSLNDLTTTDKTNTVAAINETIAAARSAISAIGTLTDLTTTDKTNTVAAINETIAAARSAISAIGTLSELTTEDKSNIVNAINSAMTFISAVYNSSERNLKTRHFLVVGDSYGDESGEWPYYTQLFLGIDDNHWHVVTEGGAGFVSNGSILFINQLINYTGDKDEITDIIVCGGANDSVSSTAGDSWWTGVQNNMTAFDTYAKTYYPNAKISLGYIANGVDYLEGGVVSGRVYACREMCKYFYNSKGSELGWNILNNVDLTLSQSIAFISSDGLHPSIFGSNALGHSISQAILTGTCEIIYPLSDACDTTQFSGNSQFKYVIRNGETILSFNDFYITAGDITNTFKVAKMNSIGFNKTFSVPCTARIDNYDNLNFQLIPARLVFDKSDVYLDLYKITNDGTYKTSFTVNVGATGYVRITDIDIIVPTRYLA